MQQHDDLGRHVAVDRDLIGHPGDVGPRAAGDVAVGGELGGPRQQRHLARVELGGHPAGRQHPVQVAEQPEAGDVGRGHHAGRERGLAGAGVEPRHRVHRRPQHPGGHGGALERGRDHAGAQRLGEDQPVTGRRPVDRHQPARVGQADDRHAVLRHRVVDRVPAGHQTAGRRRYLGAAAQHRGEHLQRQPVTRPGGQVHREQRAPAHGVDVGHRVRRRDRAPVARIIDDRREEVRGQHQRAPGVQPQDRGVVSFERADEQVAGGGHEVAGGGHEVAGGGRQAAQGREHGLELGQRQLAGAARTRGQRRQPRYRRRRCGHRVSLQGSS